MANVLEWPGEYAVLLRHPQTAFTRRDTLRVPEGRAAILVREGAFSPVYRPGDEPSLGEGLRRQEGALYLMDTRPTAHLPWGLGGVICGGRRCGVNGQMGLQVVSPRKFLQAHLGMALPLSAAALATHWMPRVADALRAQGLQASAKDAAQPEHLRELLAEATREALVEPLEEGGLALSHWTVDPLFFPEE